MPRDIERTRRRILDAAYELFYRKGFSRVGVDEIAATASLTERTLYYHFQSKGHLLASVLALHSGLALTRIRKYENRYRGSADQIVEVLFSEMAKWSAKPGWTGAGFTRLVMELADLRGHPARAIAHRHKAVMEAWLAGLLEDAGVSSPLERAREGDAAHRGGNCADPYSRRPNLRRSSRPGRKDTRQRIAADYAVPTTSRDADTATEECAKAIVIVGCTPPRTSASLSRN